MPYARDAIAKPFKIARRAPKVAEAIESLLKGGDKLAGAGKAALKDTGPSGGRAESPPSALLALAVGPPRLRARALKAGFLLGHAGTHLV